MKNILLWGNNVSLLFTCLCCIVMYLHAISCLSNMPETFPYKFFSLFFWDNGILQRELYQPISPQPAPAQLCLTDTFHHWWQKQTPDCWSHLSRSEGTFTHQGGPASTSQKPPGAWSVYVSEHKQAMFFSCDVASCFALNQPTLVRNASSLKLATTELGAHSHPHSLWSHGR